MKSQFIAAIFLLFITQQAVTQNVITLNPSKDNTLYEDEGGSLSNGAGNFLFAGTTNQNSDFIRRALLHFDVAAALPTDAVINSVQLTLNMSKTISDNHNISLHRVTMNWGEGTSNATTEEGEGIASTTNDATWIHTFFDTDFWQTPGGDFNASASANLMVGREGSYTWGSTPEMVNDVQSWVDTPENNFGWILIGDETTDGNAKRFDSREHPDANLRPMLQISYTGTPTATTEAGVPAPARLKGNYPNPFRSRTTIFYTLDTPQIVTLELIDLQGRVVRTLAQAGQTAGTHQVLVEADGLPAGLYLYRLTTETSTQYKKLILQK